MALRDYICCGGCGCKIVPDGHDIGRDRMEEIWGDPTAGEVYTVELLCPDCIRDLRTELALHKYLPHKMR